jgi:Ca2+-binding RTX toxin-like protein
MSLSTSVRQPQVRNEEGPSRKVPGWTSISRVLLLVGAATLFPVPSASANHIAGATYNGTVQGGTGMSFTVSGDGSGIASFSVAGPLSGGSCSFSGVSATYPSPLPITNHMFTDSTPPLTFSGSFPGQQGASGTVRVRTTNPPCDTGDLTWTATTTAAPPPPPPDGNGQGGARCGGRAATEIGTAGPDNLRGTAGRDVIVARGGKDIIAALGGNDLVCAGGEGDTVRGGNGKDRLLGQAGNDRLLGQAGNDSLAGGSGSDTLLGGPGLDALAGGAGRDIQRQ